MLIITPFKTKISFYSKEETFCQKSELTTFVCVLCSHDSPPEKVFLFQNDTLERNVEHLEERLAREASENQDLLLKLHKELDSTKEVNRCEICNVGESTEV